MPPGASRHIGGSRQGHPPYTDARKGRPWGAHKTIHSVTNVRNQKTGTTVFNNVHGCGAVLSPVSTQDRIQQRTEQIVQRRPEVDGQFVGSRKQPRQRTQGHTPDLSDQSQERRVDRQSPE